MPGTTLPPFPDGVRVQSLSVIDYELVAAGDENEIERLWQAATTFGFWYFKNHGTGEAAMAMFDMGAETLKLPLEEKLEYEQGSDGRSFGYKKMGANAVDASGLPDIPEFMNISKDDVLAYPEQVHRTYPSTVRNAIRSVVRPFIEQSMTVTNTVFRVFDQRLGLPEGTLEGLHARDMHSGSETRLIKAPPMPGQDTAERATIGAHTDFGSLALLHNILGGLQVLLEGQTQWSYVKPIPEHIICNIGDALAVFTAGILKSSVHRVVPPPGVQGEHERWSLVFFTRPNNIQVLRALVEHSTVIAEAAKLHPPEKFETGSTAQEWFARRIKYQRLENRAGPQSWAASRGTEHDPKAK